MAERRSRSRSDRPDRPERPDRSDRSDRSDRADKAERADRPERRERRERLDTPRDSRRPLVRRPAYDSDAFGVFAEQFARFMGTATFLIYMTLFVVLWVAFNALAPSGAQWDGYPFIFLTLMLSLQASYAAPLILLAQNRQEQRDKVIAEQDRQANARAHADMEFLAREVASLRMAVGEVATRDYVRSELRSLLGELDDRVQEAVARIQDERGPSHDAQGDPAGPPPS